MKRLIAALSLAALASSAFALEVGKPFEQIDIDRALPNVQDPVPSATVYPLGGSAPYEQLAVDRALPNLPQNPRMLAAAGGDTRSDAEIATERQPEAIWADDHNFVAPAQ